MSDSSDAKSAATKPDARKHYKATRKRLVAGLLVCQHIGGLKETEETHQAAISPLIKLLDQPYLSAYFQASGTSASALKKRQALLKANIEASINLQQKQIIPLFQAQMPIKEDIIKGLLVLAYKEKERLQQALQALQESKGESKESISGDTISTQQKKFDAIKKELDETNKEIVSRHATYIKTLTEHQKITGDQLARLRETTRPEATQLSERIQNYSELLSQDTYSQKQAALAQAELDYENLITQQKNHASKSKPKTDAEQVRYYKDFDDIVVKKNEMSLKIAKLAEDIAGLQARSASPILGGEAKTFNGPVATVGVDKYQHISKLKQDFDTLLASDAFSRYAKATYPCFQIPPDLPNLTSRQEAKLAQSIQNTLSGDVEPDVIYQDLQNRYRGAVIAPVQRLPRYKLYSEEIDKQAAKFSGKDSLTQANIEVLAIGKTANEIAFDNIQIKFFTQFNGLLEFLKEDRFKQDAETLGLNSQAIDLFIGINNETINMITQIEITKRQLELTQQQLESAQAKQDASAPLPISVNTLKEKHSKIEQHLSELHAKHDQMTQDQYQRIQKFKTSETKNPPPNASAVQAIGTLLNTSRATTLGEKIQKGIQNRRGQREKGRFSVEVKEALHDMSMFYQSVRKFEQDMFTIAAAEPITLASDKKAMQQVGEMYLAHLKQFNHDTKVDPNKLEKQLKSKKPEQRLNAMREINATFLKMVKQLPKSNETYQQVIAKLEQQAINLQRDAKQVMTPPAIPSNTEKTPSATPTLTVQTPPVSREQSSVDGGPPFTPSRQQQKLEEKIEAKEVKAEKDNLLEEKHKNTSNYKEKGEKP